MCLLARERAETFVQQVRDGNVLTNEEIVLRRLKDIEVLINEENEKEWGQMEDK